MTRTDVVSCSAPAGSAPASLTVTTAAVVTTTLSVPASYRPGRFYERELPGLLAVLQEAGEEFKTIVIDGYVHLKPHIGKGLGT